MDNIHQANVIIHDLISEFDRDISVAKFTENKELTERFSEHINKLYKIYYLINRDNREQENAIPKAVVPKVEKEEIDALYHWLIDHYSMESEYEEYTKDKVQKIIDWLFGSMGHSGYLTLLARCIYNTELQDLKYLATLEFVSKYTDDNNLTPQRAIEELLDKRVELLKKYHKTFVYCLYRLFCNLNKEEPRYTPESVDDTNILVIIYYIVHSELPSGSLISKI